MVATILVGMLCAHLLCFSAMFFLIGRRLHGSKMGMDLFATGNLMLGLAYALQSAEGGPAWSLMSVIGHTLTLAAPVAYWLGAMRFFGRSVPFWRPLLAVAGAYIAVQVLVQWGFGSVARYALLSAMMALLFLAMTATVIYGVLTFARDLYGEMIFFAVLISGICILNAIKFVNIVGTGLDALRMSGGFQIVFYVYMSFLATVLPPAIVWLVLRRLTDELRNVAARDPLTKLLNRRGLTEALQRHFSFRKAEPAFLVMVDVDHFKRINDNHGHQAGDQALCRVADVLRTHVRGSDLTVRTGGEEFAVICMNADAREVAHLAERLRSAIENTAIFVDGVDGPLHCTATIGISRAFTGEDALESAMKEADAALYQGKAAGRNRVEMWEAIRRDVPASMSDPQASW
jgi:diguanylate cyclase (GGDEF)-like protein